MLKIGLDIGTGFVKCVSDYGHVRFPSVYVKRIHGHWTDKTSEAVGVEAMTMLDTMGASVISPISRGRPDSRYSKQVELLIKETINQIHKNAKTAIDPEQKIKIAVGLPYHAFGYKDTITKLIKKIINVEECTAVAQASGTLVDLDQSSGIVVSIGQGTTEIVVVEDFEVIDGDSSRWASDFITKKIGKFAHLDVAKLVQNKETCKKYSKILTENLSREICDMAENYQNRYPIALSGGGLLIPGVHNELTSNLKDYKILIPDNPVMSNANGLYKLVE